MKILETSKGANPNYLAKVVVLKNLRQHPNANRLQLATVDGYTIITGLNAKEGDLQVFFPIECVINHRYLSYSNSFDTPELNADKTTKSFFGSKGRVRAIRLRTVMSEGYIVPIDNIIAFAKDVLKVKLKVEDLKEGVEFDTIGGEKFVWKYEVPIKLSGGIPGNKQQKLLRKYESKLVERQFSFHDDTRHLKREMYKVTPDSLISISNKIHGANFCVSNVLVKRKLSIVEKVAKFLGAKVQETEYGLIYASRKAVKNGNLNESPNAGYYGVDLWKIVADQVYPFLKRGITAYGEVYGYTPTGGMIQKNYDYGCKEGQLDFVVFRLTYTNICGDVFEFTWPQVLAYCKVNGLKTPETYYYGKARDLFPNLDINEHWKEEFISKMCETYLEKDCHLCKSSVVPAEGVILVLEDTLQRNAFKLKSNRFIERETKMLDKGEVGVEDQDDSTPDDEILHTT
mgnify:CR=1 FL=1